MCVLVFTCAFVSLSVPVPVPMPVSKRAGVGESCSYACVHVRVCLSVAFGVCVAELSPCVKRTHERRMIDSQSL